MNLNSFEIISSFRGEVNAVLTRLPVKDIELVVKILAKTSNQGKRVDIFGNGGSAATASHFACDLARGAIRPEKPGFKAFALTDGIPLVSAWANDSAYENIFAEQLENYVEAGDVAIAISGSGNSPNV